MDYETVRYEQTDHVVTLTYDRPEQHNAVNRVMNRELHNAWQRFRDDDEALQNAVSSATTTSSASTCTTRLASVATRGRSTSSSR